MGKKFEDLSINLNNTFYNWSTTEIQLMVGLILLYLFALWRAVTGFFHSYTSPSLVLGNKIHAIPLDRLNNKLQYTALSLRVERLRCNLFLYERFKRAFRKKSHAGWNTSILEDDYADEEDYYVFDDTRFQTLLCLLFTLVFLFCFFGNLTVVLVMRLHWRMRSVTKFCLGNLAFANLCVGIFCIYQNLSLYVMDSWIFGNILCKMYHFTNSLCHTASILILVVISVERYFAILHPFKCRRVLTIQRLRIIIIAVWVASALLCSPRLFFIMTIKHPLPVGKGEPPEYEIICSIGSSLFDSKTADLIQFLLLFLLPILTITVLYTQIGLSLRRRQFPHSTPNCPKEGTPDIPTHSNSTSNGSRDGSNSIRKPKTRSKFNKSFWGRGNRNAGSGSKDQTLKSVLAKRTTGFKETVVRTKCTCQDKTETSIPEATPERNQTTFSGESEGAEKGCYDKKLFRHFGCIRVKFNRGSASKNSLGLLCYGASVTRIPCRHKGVIRMLVLIVVTFTICNLPFHLRKLYQHYFHKPGEDSIWTDLSTPFTFLLVYANCAINPFLYAFMSRRFRKCVSDLFKCRLRRRTDS